jgi:hypothetical protein
MEASMNNGKALCPMAQKPSSSPDPGFQEVTMSLLTRGWFESLHPEIDRFFVKIEATRRSGSYPNEPKGWKRIPWLALAAVAMGGGCS